MKKTLPSWEHKIIASQLNPAGNRPSHRESSFLLYLCHLVHNSFLWLYGSVDSSMVPYSTLPSFMLVIKRVVLNEANRSPNLPFFIRCTVFLEIYLNDVLYMYVFQIIP